MATVTNQSDRFIMLLSADWFSQFWKDFGLVFSKSEQELTVGVSRKVIRELLKGADTYWGVNFSPERVSATRSSFLAELRKLRLAETAVAQLADAMEVAEESAEVATTLWLYGALLDQLIGSTDALAPPGVSAPSFRTLKVIWKSSMTAEISRRQLEGALMASASPWDRALRDATPDLPTYLSDWAMTGLQRPERFQRFWAELFWVVSQSERAAIKKWLEEEAIKLADPTFRLTEPAWMRVE